MGPTLVWCLCPSSEAVLLAERLVGDRVAGVVDVIPSGNFSSLGSSAQTSHVPLLIFTEESKLQELFDTIVNALGQEPEIIACIATPDAGDRFSESLEDALWQSSKIECVLDLTFPTKS